MDSNTDNENPKNYQRGYENLPSQTTHGSSQNDGIHWLMKDVEELRSRVEKIEDKYDVIYDLAASIKTMSIQLVAVNDNVTEMKKDFKSDISDLKDQQMNITHKVDRLEIDNDSNNETKDSKQKLKSDVMTSVVERVVEILLIIVILALFPQLASIVQ